MIRTFLLHRTVALIVAATLSCAGAVGVVLSQSTQATAASQRSYGGNWSPYGGFIGNYFNAHTNTFVYCVDLWATDVASGGPGVSVNSLASHAGGAIGGQLGATLGGTRLVQGTDLQKLNYAVSVHGQTTDHYTAAAVAAYVWGITSDVFTGNGEHFIAGPHRTQILEKYRHVKNDTEQHFNEGSDGVGEMTIQTNAANHYQGTIEITGLQPQNALGSITLTNAVFADTGQPTQDGLVNDTVLDIVGVPPTQASHYTVQAEAAFSASTPVRYTSNVQMYQDTGQRSVGPGEKKDLVNFRLATEDAQPRSTLFEPIVGTTVASTYVQLGDEFSDIVSFSARANSEGTHNPWYFDENVGHTPITAVGTLYGPMLAPPIESDTPPANAPVAASNIRITTDAQAGETQTVQVHSGHLSQEAGYYTWVWQIDAAEQSEASRVHLPEGYHFSDRYGQVAETSITPSTISIHTQLTHNQVKIGESVADRVNLSLINGGWLQKDAKRVPVVLRGTAYFSKSRPQLADHAPADAEVLSELFMTADSPGSFLSESVQLPNKPGYVTFQWCINKADQAAEVQGMITETCDRYGQESETVEIVDQRQPLPSTGRSLSHDVLLASASSFMAGLGIIGTGVSLRRRRVV